MQPSTETLSEAIGMMPPLIGFYDVPDKDPFEPFAIPQNCVFSCYEQWIHGESTCISEENCGSIGCPGAGYWLCGVESVPRTDVAYFLAGQEGLKEEKRLAIAVKGGDPNVDRLTLTLPVLNRARQVAFLVSGKEKAEIVRAALGPKEVSIPAQRVQPAKGRLTWILDRDAASLISA